MVGKQDAYHEKYKRVSGTMGRGKEYRINANSGDKGDEMFKDYTLSMELLNQNIELQQQLQQQQMAISQLKWQVFFTAIVHDGRQRSLKQQPKQQH